MECIYKITYILAAAYGPIQSNSVPNWYHNMALLEHNRYWSNLICKFININEDIRNKTKKS